MKKLIFLSILFFLSISTYPQRQMELIYTKFNSNSIEEKMIALEDFIKSKVSAKEKIMILLDLLKREVKKPTSQSKIFRTNSFLPTSEYICSKYMEYLKSFEEETAVYIEPILDSEKHNKDFYEKLIITLSRASKVRTKYQDELLKIAINSNNPYNRFFALWTISHYTLFRESDKNIYIKLLDDSFCINAGSDIRWGDERDIECPIRSQAFSILIKMGVKVKRDPNKWNNYIVDE